MPSKVCSACAETKDLDDFKGDRRRPDGHASYCKACANAKAKVIRARYEAEHGRPYESQYAEARRAFSRANPRRRLYPEAAAAGDQRRRAVKAAATIGDPFTPAQVYDRDAWTCRLCSDPIPRVTRFPHPLSPSVDHILPLSLGGAHSLDNVHAAHLTCNTSKGNRI